MTDTVTVSRERLSRMVSAIDMLIPTLPGLNDKGRTWLRDEIIESTDALRAALDAEPAPVQEPAKKLWLQHGVFPDIADFDANGLTRFYSKESAAKFQGGQCSKPCTGKNCGSMNGWMHSIECRAEHEAVITAHQTAPVQEPVYAFRRKGMDDFCTCNKARFDELASKPHLFETAIFYTAQPRTAVKLSDSEIASDASRHWSEDGVDPIAFAHAIESAVWAKNGWAE